MKLIFKYMNQNPNIKERILEVYNKKQSFLGNLYYDNIWGCWVWSQEKNIKMSKSCLQQIVDKLEELDKNARRK